MKTFQNPAQKNCPIGEFVYSGCRYSGIEPGLTFSVLSEGLATHLAEAFPFLEEVATPTETIVNKNCCSKCGRDCKSPYMRDRHEKVCPAQPKNMNIILKPIFIFWNSKELDRTQLTEDQLIPSELKSGIPAAPSNYVVINEKDVTDPMPGVEGTEMIGKHMEKVTTDSDGVPWYGGGLEDDTVKG